ncbi:hypothetical protein TMatcc_001130 [Talaromyces marneffei ATCC 18224]
MRPPSVREPSPVDVNRSPLGVQKPPSIFRTKTPAADSQRCRLVAARRCRESDFSQMVYCSEKGPSARMPKIDHIVHCCRGQNLPIWVLTLSRCPIDRSQWRVLISGIESPVATSHVVTCPIYERSDEIQTDDKSAIPTRCIVPYEEPSKPHYSD